MNIAITTGTQIHHKYLTNKLGKYFGETIKLVILQDAATRGRSAKRKKINGKLTKQLLRLLKLGAYGWSSLRFQDGDKVQKVKDINSEETKKLLKKNNIDLLLIFGGKIIRDDVLQVVDNRAINIHNGYSPYYKGANTLFWPIIENQLDKVGITIHWASPLVDSGSIIVRKRINPTRFIHKDLLFIKSIKISLGLIKTVLTLLSNNLRLPHIESQQIDKIYYGKQFTSDKQAIVKNNMIKNFFKKPLVI